MNSKFLTTVFACMCSIAQSTSGQDCMNVLTKDHQVHQFNVSDVSQISFETDGEIAVITGNAIVESPTSASVMTRATLSKDVPAILSGGIFIGKSPEKMEQIKGTILEGGQEWKSTLSNLQAGVRYYYKAYVIVDGMIHYGEMSFFDMDTEKQESSDIAFLSPYATPAEIVEKGDDDEASAWLWFHQEYPDGKFLYAGDITSEDNLQGYSVLFYIRDLNSGTEDDVWTQPSSIQQATPYIKEWYKNGGSLILWQHAVTYITDLGRISKDLLMENDRRITIGNGSWNPDMWYLAVQINPGSRYVKDFSSHPLFQGLDIRSSGRSKYITMKGSAWTEDHNCTFFNIPYKLTGKGNQDPQCYEMLTKQYGIYPLAVWDSQIDWLSQLNIWEARQGDTDYQGTILCVGNGGCEFSHKNPDSTADKSAYPKNNPFQANILRMAKNAINYLQAGEPYESPELPDTNQANVYSEPMRPQIHFTPQKNWMNDPNGMVYADGVWHLYYQYNPAGQDWGNISWGHATSTDLFHWKEQPIALSPDNLGLVFSGSAVVDKNNTAGFGENAIIAMYTSHGDYEQQCIAYSNDGGMTFTKYSGNPVIKNSTHSDFRDPKVVWDETSQAWYCVLALGGEHTAQIYRSTNLKTWTLKSTFAAPSYAPGCNRGVWECSDLYPIQYKGERKWILAVNVSNGGPVLGSGTMYFVGDFTNGRFTPDRYDYPLWIDHGLDNYAGVTWSNTGDRHIFIGWMNNQAYGGYPVYPWRCCMTLPRELALVEYEGRPLLTSVIVPEIEGISGEWNTPSSSSFFIKKEKEQMPDAYQLNVSIDTGKDYDITLGNSAGQEYVIHYVANSKELIIDRGSNTGQTSFHANFAIPTIRSSVYTSKAQTTLCIYVDQSNVEVTTEDGSVVMSTLVFPTTIYDRCSVKGATDNIRYRLLNSVWR